MIDWSQRNTEKLVFENQIETMLAMYRDRYGVDYKKETAMDVLKSMLPEVRRAEFQVIIGGKSEAQSEEGK